MVDPDGHLTIVDRKKEDVRFVEDLPEGGTGTIQDDVLGAATDA